MLTKDLNKSYSVRSLYNMQLYYEEICCNEKMQPVAAILRWSNYCELLRLNDDNKIIYYINTCKLICRMKNKEYQWFDEKTKLKLTNEDNLNSLYL